MNRLFNAQVNNPMFAKQTGENEYFGHDFGTIYRVITGKGLGDFKVSELLSENDAVLCYCFIFMKQHYYVAYANFLAHEVELNSKFANNSTVKFIDVGCGPATAGLAFSEAIDAKEFLYYAVDRASAMRDKARSMINEGITEGVIHKSTRTIRRESWNDISTDRATDANVILNFSYFFGSPFLSDTDIRSLARFYRRLAKANQSVLISYTNSRNRLANTNYLKFNQNWVLRAVHLIKSCDTLRTLTAISLPRR